MERDKDMANSNLKVDQYSKEPSKMRNQKEEEEF